VREDKRWQIILAPRADSGLREILAEHGDEAYEESLSDLLALEDNPTPPDSRRMSHTNDPYRIYICRSMYRAIYRPF